MKQREDCTKIHENITVTMQRLDTCEGIIANNRLGSQVNTLGNSREVISFLHQAEDSVRKCRLGIDRENVEQNDVLIRMKRALTNAIIPAFSMSIKQRESGAMSYYEPK